MERNPTQVSIDIKHLDTLVAETLYLAFDQELFTVAAAGKHGKKNQRNGQKYGVIAHSLNFFRQKYEIILNFASRETFSLTEALFHDLYKQLPDD